MRGRPGIPRGSTGKIGLRGIRMWEIKRPMRIPRLFEFYCMDTRKMEKSVKNYVRDCLYIELYSTTESFRATLKSIEALVVATNHPLC